MCYRAARLPCFVVVAGALLLLTLSGCGTKPSAREPTPANLDRYFVRDVATAQAINLPVYWLGPQFAAGGLVFRGPYGVEFGTEAEEVQSGVLEMTYLAPLEPRGNTGLDLMVHTRYAWELAKDKVMNPGVPGVARKRVAVGGRQGELITIPLGTRPLNTLWLVLDLGHVVVLAQAGAGGPMYPGGPDYNPFINNPDLLIQVLEENLRPYPE